MSALDLLKARENELTAQAAARKATDELWRSEQMRQLEPIKLALREIAAANPPVRVKVSSSMVLDFREAGDTAESRHNPLHIGELGISLRLGYESRLVCSYNKPSSGIDGIHGCHFDVRDEARYGKKRQTFTDPIEVINYLVTQIAESTAK
jgi:hypothetical protein